MRLMVVFALLIGVAGQVDAGCTLNTLPTQSYGGYAASSASYEVTAGACLSCVPAPAVEFAPRVEVPMYATSSAAVYAAPTYYSASFQAPVFRTHVASYPIQRSFQAVSYAPPVTVNRTVINRTYVSAPAFPVRQSVYGGHSASFQGGFGGRVGLGGVSPGGFRAGFAGRGLNGAGGSGFLTGGGLLGGAANLLGVSSAGLEGAALGILATRSNLFGLAPRRR